MKYYFALRIIAHALQTMENQLYAFEIEYAAHRHSPVATPDDAKNGVDLDTSRQNLKKSIKLINAVTDNLRDRNI